MSLRSYCSYVNLSTVRENKISKIFFLGVQTEEGRFQFKPTLEFVRLYSKMSTH